VHTDSKPVYIILCYTQRDFLGADKHFVWTRNTNVCGPVIWGLSY